MKLYDNLDDAKAKLDGTLAYYDGKAIYIHQVTFDNNPNDLVVQISSIIDKKKILVKLDDPKFNYIHYNIGYVNGNYASVWWRRQPIKQYKQGLKREQLNYAASDTAFYDYAEFGANYPTIAMMENRYPTIAECEQKLKDREVAAIAFHRNFGATYDRLHKDLVIEYQAKKIGICTNLNHFELSEDYQYLSEALKEAVA